MQTSSIAQLKQEIQTIPHPELMQICLKLIKFKKENKELLHYLIFESNNESRFIAELKKEISAMFLDVNTQTVYFAKKTIRKILRVLNRYCKYSGAPVTLIELLLHFCRHMQSLPLHWHDSKTMVNLYTSQISKINKLLLSLHEDLQYDYQQQVAELQIQ